MVAFLVVGALLCALAVLSVFVSAKQTDNPTVDAAWDVAYSAIDGPVTAGLYKLARPVGSTTFLQSATRNTAFSGLRAKVIASGLYGQSLDVFLAVQTVALLISACFLTLLLFTPMGFLPRVACLLAAIGIAGLPYNKVSTTVKKKEEAVARALPEFVDLLQIPIAAGAGVLDALQFTSRFSDSPVSVEVRWLLDTIAARTMSEAEAFRLAGQRIGTPEAVAFFTTMGQSYIEGAEISGALAKQSESLRVKAYQARRMKMKRLPVTLIVTFAIHFLPFLLVMAVLPLLVSLGNATG